MTILIRRVAVYGKRGGQCLTRYRDSCILNNDTVNLDFFRLKRTADKTVAVIAGRRGRNIIILHISVSVFENAVKLSLAESRTVELVSRLRNK